jgi:hypothetical protein
MSHAPAMRFAPKRPYVHCWCGLLHFWPRLDTPRWRKRQRTIYPPNVKDNS